MINLIEIYRKLGIWNRIRYLLLKNHSIRMTSRRLEQLKNYKVTDKDRKEQAISFAYGNVKLSNPNITKEMVEKAYGQLEREK